MRRLEVAEGVLDLITIPNGRVLVEKCANRRALLRASLKYPPSGAKCFT